jgi:hypothetical protein
VAHAAIDPALGAALEAADICNAQELGCVFRRMEGITLTGLRLARAGADRACVRWRVQVCEG